MLKIQKTRLSPSQRRGCWLSWVPTTNHHSCYNTSTSTATNLRASPLPCFQIIQSKTTLPKNIASPRHETQLQSPHRRVADNPFLIQSSQIGNSIRTVPVHSKHSDQWLLWNTTYQRHFLWMPWFWKGSPENYFCPFVMTGTKCKQDLTFNAVALLDQWPIYKLALTQLMSTLKMHAACDSEMSSISPTST
jgi:hypothetical protein